VIARLAADLVLLGHLSFVVFVAVGGLLALRWPRIAWLHIPVAIWGAAVELGGWICPLTPLENRLRAAGGEAGYAGGFIEHYLVPIVYPSGLTRGHQLALGVAVLVVNLAVYGVVVRRWSRARRRPVR
jgi:hypothetical protein